MAFNITITNLGFGATPNFPEVKVITRTLRMNQIAETSSIARPDSSNFDFIFNSVVEDSEGGNNVEEAYLEQEFSLNECKVLIENNLNSIHLSTKRLEEKGNQIW